MFCPAGELPTADGCREPISNWLMNIEIIVYQKNKIKWPFPLTTALFRILQKYFDFNFEFQHQSHQENSTYLAMSVYSDLHEAGFNFAEKNKTNVQFIEEYLIKMANFISFYRVPNFEYLLFHIKIPLYSQLYDCPEGFEHRIGSF